MNSSMPVVTETTKLNELRKQVKVWLEKGYITEAKSRTGIHLNPVHIIPKGDPKNPRGWRTIVNNSWPINDVHYSCLLRLQHGFIC